MRPREKAPRALLRVIERHRARCRACRIIARRRPDARGPCDVERYLLDALGRALDRKGLRWTAASSSELAPMRKAE